MGQRLVITMKAEGKDVACCYWHWDGYTYPAAEHVSTILGRLFDLEDNHGLNYKELDGKGKKALAIDLFRETGASLSKEGLEMARKLFPDRNWSGDTDPDRNRGLIDIGPEEIRRTQGYSEADVLINLDSREVCFDVYGVRQEDEAEGPCDEKMVIRSNYPPRMVTYEIFIFTFDNWGSIEDVLQDIRLGRLYAVGDYPGFICAIE